jgi:hypothetical protein
MHTSQQNRLPFPIVILGIIALLAALWTGLTRIGWHLPPLGPLNIMVHGPLMISGFLGTVIGVERSVALRQRWVYLGPVLTALGGLALIVGLAGLPAFVLMTLGSLGLVVTMAVIVRKHPALYAVVIWLGAVAWLVGNVLWLAGWPIHQVVLWWAGFLVLTIGGERLELSRLLKLSGFSLASFYGSIALFLAGLIGASVSPDIGFRLTGIGMLALALWLLRYDIARKTVRKDGLTRFTAVCLLAGYVWLGASGVLAIVFGEVTAGVQYDALLHTLFLGFVFSMIFGHAPVIFSSLVGRDPTYRSAFYAHLILLHVSLVLRILGDLTEWVAGREWGGLLNAVAVLLFIANTARAAIAERRSG